LDYHLFFSIRKSFCRASMGAWSTNWSVTSWRRLTVANHSD
jgi:hypothetical protein